MLKRKDIEDDKMLNDLRVIAEFDCKHWDCRACPFNTVDGDCILLDIKNMVEKYDDGEEVIY